MAGRELARVMDDWGCVRACVGGLSGGQTFLGNKTGGSWAGKAVPPFSPPNRRAARPVRSSGGTPSESRIWAPERDETTLLFAFLICVTTFRKIGGGFFLNDPLSTKSPASCHKISPAPWSHRNKSKTTKAERRLGKCCWLAHSEQLA